MSGTAGAGKDKVLLVPCGHDGEAAGAVLSRIFSVPPLFVPLPDPVGTALIIKSVAASGKIPITVGLRIMDDSFYGPEGVSIESCAPGSRIGRNKWENERRVTVPSETLSEAVLKLFGDRLMDGERGVLSATINLNNWFAGKRLPAPALESALFLASARDLSPESCYPFLERFSRTARGDNDTSGFEATVLKHLSFQQELSGRVKCKELTGKKNNTVLIARAPRGATELCARLFLLSPGKALDAEQEISKRTQSPGEATLFCLPRGGESNPRRFFVRVRDAYDPDFIRHGVGLGTDSAGAVKEVFFPKSRSATFIAGCIADIAAEVRARERRSVAAEFGGLDKGI